jgi:hypothetical protein
MNLSVEYQSHKVPALKEREKERAYILGPALLLVLWAVFSSVTILVVVAAFVPGHLGLSDWLRILGDLWPADSPMFTT